jgi:hypothetical protein
MKRRTKSWQEKVDPLCIRYLQVYREARTLASKIPTTLDFKSRMATMDPAQEVFKEHPELWDTRKVSLTPAFLQNAKSHFPGFENLSEGSVVLSRTADILEMAQNLAIFDTFPPELKMGAYFFVAMLIVPAWDSLVRMKKEQFGEQPLDQERMMILVAQTCEMIAQVCRGRFPERKGKFNLELIQLVKKIQEHEKETLTPDDLKEALAAAGVSVPEGEAWRIWLWRARKSGLIPGTRRGRGQRKKPPEGESQSLSDLNDKGAQDSTPAENRSKPS